MKKINKCVNADQYREREKRKRFPFDHFTCPYDQGFN